MRRSGGYSHESFGEDKVCLLQSEDGDDQESIPVARMDRIRIQRELQYRCNSDSGRVMGSSTEGNNAADEGQQPKINSTEDASKAKQHAIGILLKHLPR